jgi:hypothetical protein
MMLLRHRSSRRLFRQFPMNNSPHARVAKHANAKENAMTIQDDPTQQLTSTTELEREIARIR